MTVRLVVVKLSLA